MKKTYFILIFLLIIIAVSTISFYGGMKYQASKRPSFQSSFQRIKNLQTQTIQREGNLWIGEVINKDEESITIKMIGGSTKIIFLSDTTQFLKTVDASKEDIEIGKQIIVRGEEISGGINAKVIQISPPYFVNPRR